jgi:hypothetical protein
MERRQENGEGRPENGGRGTENGERRLDGQTVSSWNASQIGERPDNEGSRWIRMDAGDP